jgi:hypothetical protein
MLGGFVRFPGVAARPLATISHPSGVSNARFINLKMMDISSIQHLIPADMNIVIPIYIELIPQEGRPTPTYSIRPLFFQEPAGPDEELQRAIAKFVKVMRRELDGEGRRLRQDGLVAYSFAPEIEE